MRSYIAEMDESVLEQARSKCSEAVFAENWGMINEANEAVREALDLLEQWLSATATAAGHPSG